MGKPQKKKKSKPTFIEGDEVEISEDFDLDDEDLELEEFDGKEAIDLPPVEATIIGDKIVSPITKSSSYFHERNYYGTKEGDTFVFTTFEAVLFHERNKAIIKMENSNEPMKFKDLVAFAVSLDEKFWMRYQVYRDLRSRGYVVREGIGSNMDFRIYPRGTQLNTDNAKYFIYVLPEWYPVEISLLEVLSRQALSSRKDLLLAIVDQLGDISYYQMNNYSFKENTKVKPFFENIA